jgi:hypothetical protein
MTQINGEPACADYLQLREGVQPDDPALDDRGGNIMARRRADLGFTCALCTILVDCTTASPLAKEIKEYKPGRAADAATKRKVREYQRFFNIQQSNRCNLFFFAVETSGGLGKEARDFGKLLARLDGGPMGSVIQRIYQLWRFKTLEQTKSITQKGDT